MLLLGSFHIVQFIPYTTTVLQLVQLAKKLFPELRSYFNGKNTPFTENICY